ncbi:hypothetical protein M9H77_32309 [Catharanthus roseus]|uniref:Uncharacterized protein n=1 Tax=Catharanthus roseus TaxID=4058 RepID=A0ACC0A2K9_CATRO|nr:hypothetical protein M9H77_32309 [Catharanthus roseus]
MVVNAGGHTSISFGMVRLHRYLGSSSRCFLQDRDFITQILDAGLYNYISLGAMYNFKLQELTEVHGRTFGIWTLLTCTLCFLTAFNLDNKPLYLATFLSFIYAFGHFLTEYLIYHTMAIANLTTVGIFAGTSIVWMLLQWNAHQPVKTKDS